MHHQNVTTTPVATKFLPENSKTYIHHPKYGLLQRICTVDEQKDLCTSLYAKSLFFLVTVKDMDTVYQPIVSEEAKKLLENHLLNLHQNQRSLEYEQLKSVWQRTFS
jgi:PII interaction protein X